MNPLRSVGVRLSIALLLVVAAALGAAYLVVVPRLQDRLVNSRVAQFNHTADQIYTDAANDFAVVTRSGMLDRTMLKRVSITVESRPNTVQFSDPRGCGWSRRSGAAWVAWRVWGA